VKKEDWIWMPHPGHFIGANNCKFRLNTYVGGYIVSTVGEYFPVGAEEMMDLGFDRKYETMVFEAQPNNEKEWQCCPYQIDVGEERDIKGYNHRNDAVRGHYQLCGKWSEE